MEPEKLKNALEEKYLAACAEIRAINEAQKKGRDSGCKITDTVMSMLAMERKKTILDIYGIAFPYEALHCLIEKGMAAEKTLDIEEKGEGNAA